MEKSRFFVGACLCAIGLTSAPAHAQDTETRGVRLDDVVVTARRKEENIQTTPVAVTALSGEALRRQQVVTLTDLQRTGPGLLLRTGLPGIGTQALIGIRGQGNLNSTLANDPSVAIYLDGVYIPRTMKDIATMRDLERVEVLRGPQGTLFGRNTTGGALNVITKNPTDRLEAEVNGELGNFDERNLGLVVNIPLASNLAARLAYNFHDVGGFVKDPILQRDFQDETSHLVRGKLKYDGNNFDVMISGDYNNYKDKGQPSVYLATNPASLINTVYGAANVAPYIHSSSNWWTTYAGGAVVPTSGANAAVYSMLTPEAKAVYARKPFNTMEAYGFNATVNANLGDLKLKSITGYRYMLTEAIIDTDGTPLPILLTYGGQKSRQISEELQLSGNITDKISFIAGAYYGKEIGYDDPRSQTLGSLIRNSYSTSQSITKGLFAQGYVQLTEALRFTGGYRYTWDEREVNLQAKQVLGLPNDAPATLGFGGVTGFNCQNSNITTAPAASRAAVAAQCSEVHSADFSYPAWTAVLDWQANHDLFFYAKTSGAARAGGFNNRAGSFPPFAPEKVVDVEGGVKATFLDNRLRANVAVFNSWRKKIQANVIAFVPGIGATAYVQNNGDSQVRGAEFEVTAAPWSGMEVNLGLSALDGRYDKGSFTEFRRFAFAGAPPAGCSATPGVAGSVDCTVDLSGTSLAQLPKTQFNIGFTQTIPSGDNEFAIHLDYAYVSSQIYAQEVALPQQSAADKAGIDGYNRYSVLPAYGYANARISYNITRRDIELYAFARNITNEKYISGRFGELYTSLGFAHEFPGPPRMWGVGVNMKFGK